MNVRTPHHRALALLKCWSRTLVAPRARARRGDDDTTAPPAHGRRPGCILLLE